MPIKPEWNALESEINISLLNDIIAFVLDTAKVDYAQKHLLQDRCILMCSDTRGDVFQGKYRFLYLGELLERYDERFGMSTRDRRAIALALGYTRDILTAEMFVGNQRNAFLQEILRFADGDIYLMSALYLLNEGQSGETVWLERLREFSYSKTEELLFAMSVLPDFDDTFNRFKPLLFRFLGCGRTMAVVGNRKILDWVVAKLSTVIKALRGKDISLFRALCALPTSFVKRGSKPHSTLLEHGYTPLEIVYLNIGIIQYHTTASTLHLNSITAEKIVIDLFEQALCQEAPLDPEMYPKLSELYPVYEQFPIRCYGHSKLLETLKERSLIQNADTFAWFSKYAGFAYPAFAAFDIMDGRWDALASSLPEKKYLELFESRLTQELDKQAIQAQIARFDALTGKEYIGLYRDEELRCSKFSLLVQTGIIDLWDAFRASIDAEGTVCAPGMMKYIKPYLRGIRTPQAFQFYQKFLPQYGFGGYKKYLASEHDTFASDLMCLTGYDCSSQGGAVFLERDYLKDDETYTITLLQWLEEYLFQCEPDKYLAFVRKLLLSESETRLLPPEKLRALFDLIAAWPDLTPRSLAALRKKYWTAEEQAAEAAVQAAAALAADQKKREKQLQHVRGLYESKKDGTIQSLLDFMEMSFISIEEKPLLYDIALEHLGQLLNEKNYMLESPEAICLLRVFQHLAKAGRMSFTEVQSYLFRIKEVSADDARNNTDHPSDQ